MRRRGATRAFVGLLIAASVVFSSVTAVSADPLSDAKAEATRLVRLKSQLRESGERLAEQLNGAQVDLEAVTQEVALAQVKVSSQEAEIAALGEQLTQFAVRSYMHGSSGESIVSLFADGLSSDSVQREGYASIVLGGSADATDALRAAREDSVKLRAALLSKQKRATDLTATVEQRKKDLAKSEADLLKLEQQNSAEMQRLIREAEEVVAAKELAAVAERIRRQSEEIRRNAASQLVTTAPRNVRGASSTTVLPGVKPSPTTAPKQPVVAPPPMVSGSAGRAVAAAWSQIGVPYRYATSNPGVSFDCSGLTMWVWGQAGVQIPRTSQQQYAGLPKVPLDSLQPGDLVFYYGDLHHVGIYIGGGQVIHAPYTGSRVESVPIRGSVFGAARPG